MKQNKLLMVAMAAMLAVVTGISLMGLHNLWMKNWPVLRADASTADALAVFDTGIARSQIARIQFEASLKNAPKSAWDVSQGRNGKVLAWLVKGKDRLYDLHIAGDSGIQLPEDCTRLFAGYENVTEIDFGNSVSTANVTDMGGMFQGCTRLITLDLTHFDTRRVTDMSGMFQGCTSLTTLDVTHFDTRNVTDMSGMFQGCTSLTTLDVTHFDTRKVEDTNAMFSLCTSLTSIKASPHFVIPEKGTLGMFDLCPAGGLTIE